MGGRGVKAYSAVGRALRRSCEHFKTSQREAKAPGWQLWGRYRVRALVTDVPMGKKGDSGA